MRCFLSVNIDEREIWKSDGGDVSIARTVSTNQSRGFLSLYIYPIGESTFRYIERREILRRG